MNLRNIPIPHIPIFKKQPVKYEGKYDSTASLSAPSHLPYVAFTDPKAVQLPNVGFRWTKVVVENMSTIVKNKPIPVFAIVMVMFGAAVVGAILYDRVFEPYTQQQQEFQLKLQDGTLTEDDRPPSLFDFSDVQIPIPGVRPDR